MYKKLFFMLLFLNLILALGLGAYLLYSGRGKILFGKVVALKDGGVIYRNYTEKYGMLDTQAAGVDYVFLGNSITFEGPWIEFYDQRKVLNRGIPGDRLQGLINRLPSIISLQPRCILVMGGINDLLTGASAEDCGERYEQLITKASVSHRLIVFSTLYTFYDSKVNNEVTRLNERVRDFCKSNGIIWIDLNEVLCEGNRLKEEFTYDGIHLNINGYQQWKSLLDQFLP